MSLHLHVGVEPARLDTVQQMLEPRTTYVDGDGWEAWGEKPGTDINKPSTLHLIVEIEDDEIASNIAAITIAGLRSLLTPMEADFQKNIIGVLSDAENWTTLHGGPAEHFKIP